MNFFFILQEQERIAIYFNYIQQKISPTYSFCHHDESSGLGDLQVSRRKTLLQTVLMLPGRQRPSFPGWSA